MSATPTQLRKLAELLSTPADDVDVLAASAWALMESLQGSRERFVTVAYHPQHNVLVAVGPYNTDLQARRDAVHRVVQTGGTQVRIARLYAPDGVSLDGTELSRPK